MVLQTTQNNKRSSPLVHWAAQYPRGRGFVDGSLKCLDSEQIDWLWLPNCTMYVYSKNSPGYVTIPVTPDKPLSVRAIIMQFASATLMGILIV